MTNETEGRRMTPAELKEMCICAAATAVVSQCALLRVQRRCRSPRRFALAGVSDVNPTSWEDLRRRSGDEEPAYRDAAYEIIASIYEAGGLAALKLRDLGSHTINFGGLNIEMRNILPKV